MENSISEYFFRARDIVDKYRPHNRTVIQFFQKHDFAVLAGMDEVLELLRDKLEGTGTVVRYLSEGTVVGNREVVLELEGRYQDFGIYEGIIDGILSRATSIATNSRRCLDAAKGKEVICMSDRSDHYLNHPKDGWAMYVGGIRSFSCSAQVPKRKRKECIVYGSVPHALIQNFHGDTVASMVRYSELFPKEDLVALVDFHNDVIGESIKVLETLRDKLKGVRVDTSGNMKDVMFSKEENEYGVTPNQIKRLRAALDREDCGKGVKIFVSSGFTPEKIGRFEAEGTPVDGYGVGEFLLKINHSFCADAVKVDGVELAKAGRGYKKNKKLVECLM